MTAGDGSGASGTADIRSKATKSFPDPLSFQNAAPAAKAPPARAAPRSEPSTDRPPAQAPHHEDRLAHDVAGHLALPLRPIVEDDRDLDDVEPAAPRPEAHLDLERVTVRPDVV